MSDQRCRSDADRLLLERHLPILRLDRRELFTPTGVDGYVAGAGLWDRHGQIAERVGIDELDDRWGPSTHLRFVAEPERRGLLRDEIKRTTRRLLSSRLGAVGLFGRLIDAVFQLSVWLRPTTPRLTTAAAATKAERLGLHDEPVCHGRVARAGEWLVLHYAWFYVMNDWRTSYRGLNDHEADWEQAWVFCDPEDRSPVWVAASNHDHRGADLRRHWSDPELMIEGDRPVLYAAAGSHALYYRPGDYVTRIDIPGLRWLARSQRFVSRRFRMVQAPTARGVGPALGVPFIDAAGGDGVAVVDPTLAPMEGVAWAESFRGLWGRDTGDPLQGERGPSGPKYDRNGEVRSSWADPLGFAGLHGTPPPSATAARVNLEKIDRAIEELDERIRHRGRLLPLAHQTGSTRSMADESRRLTRLLCQRTELEGLRRSVAAGRIRQDGVREHLRHPAVPLPAPERGAWVLAAWAALTVPLLLAVCAFALLVDGVRTAAVLGLAAAGFVLVEQLVRRRLRVAALVATAVATAWFSGVVAGPVVTATGWVARVLIVIGAAGLLVTNLAELYRPQTSGSHRRSDRASAEDSSPGVQRVGRARSSEHDELKAEGRSVGASPSGPSAKGGDVADRVLGQVPSPQG